VGEVPASVTRTIAGGGLTTAIGSSIPYGGSFQSAVGSFAPSDGDTVNGWNTSNNDFDGTIATYFTEISAWDTDQPFIVPGVGMFLTHYGSAQVWTRNFVVGP